MPYSPATQAHLLDLLVVRMARPSPTSFVARELDQLAAMTWATRLVAPVILEMPLSSMDGETLCHWLTTERTPEEVVVAATVLSQLDFVRQLQERLRAHRPGRTGRWRLPDGSTLLAHPVRQGDQVCVIYMERT